MLTRIEISGYQSLKRARIPLGRFTVITGPSGSGKSGTLRAVQLAARNASGASYVTRGAAHCAVALIEEDGPRSRAVLIRRGARSTAGDFYRLQARGPDGKSSKDYTKLGGKVPDKVAEALRLGDLNFAGQFAGPFLLAETGTEVARVLGELTNVSMVLRAAAEAGRVRKQLERDARTAAVLLESLLGLQQDYAGLDGQRAAIAEAEQALDGIEAGRARVLRLWQLADRLEAAAAAAEQAAAAAVAAAPPDLARLEQGLAKLTRLRALDAAYAEADQAVTYWAGEARAAAGREEAAHAAVHSALVAAGQCPLCGQEVRGPDDADGVCTSR
jgi:DNA repair ATPase RecN